MNKLLVNEYLKLKGTFIPLICILGGIFTPVIVTILSIIINNSGGQSSVTIIEFVSMNARFIVKTIAILFYTFIGCEIVTREFRLDTYKENLLMPIPKNLHFISKLLFVSILLLIITMISCIITITLTIVQSDQILSPSLVVAIVTIFFRVGILTLPLVYFTMVLGWIFENNFFPMVMNVIMYILTFLMTPFDPYRIFPYSAPFYIVFKQFENQYLPYLSILLFGVLSILIGQVIVNKKEI